MTAPSVAESAPAARPLVPPFAGLAAATLAVSFAAIFISKATAPPLVTATYRMVFTVALLIPLLLRRRTLLVAVSGRDVALLAAAGLLLAAHFATWTVSLFYTSVASSVLFVTVHPVLVAALAWLFLHERPRRVVAIGIGLTMLGSLVIASGDVRLGGRALVGDGLALAGAVVFAFYLMIGRSVRRRLDPITYSTPVYAVCALALAVLALAGRQQFGPLSWHNAMLFLALALVCTLGGHLVYNWTLRYVDTAVVSVSFLGEPVIAALLAWPLLGQPIHALTAAGGVLVLTGIYLATKNAT